MSRRKIRKGSPQRNVPNEGGVSFSAIFNQYVVISRKRCILDTKLLQGGNRKPCASYRMVSLSMTWVTSDPGFKDTVVLKGEYLQSDAFYRRLIYKTLIGNDRHAIDRQASYTAYNPTALTQTCKLFASVARVCQQQLAFFVGTYIGTLENCLSK